MLLKYMVRERVMKSVVLYLKNEQWRLRYKTIRTSYIV